MENNGRRRREDKMLAKLVDFVQPYTAPVRCMSTYNRHAWEADEDQTLVCRRCQKLRNPVARVLPQV